MLQAPVSQPLTDLDLLIFEGTVPQDHYLRRVHHAIDFPRFRLLLACAYDPGRGRPALEPVLLKLEFLQYHYNLSDRAVLDQARYNMAFRLFLGLSLHSPLPDPSLLSYFRRRLGDQRHQQFFDEVVGGDLCYAVSSRWLAPGSLRIVLNPLYCQQFSHRAIPLSATLMKYPG